MNKKVTYKNRHGDKFVFKINERKNIQWSGNFEFHRYGFNDNPKDITMVDPSGGPYIDLDYNMEMFDKSFKGMNVSGFIGNDDGYELVINQNK
tara:strand:- start:954 stop:1232 length:279 start_codon:yes stop_codon:yes gene_type:complete